MKQYLYRRPFRVYLQGDLSDIRQIRAGTPQGSVLSPLLYSILTYDFPQCQHIDTCLFADDTAAPAKGSTEQFVPTSLQKLSNTLEE
ncbi:hypothetical protein AVEN_8069-1 [Araneus ventricosus]|uniref:Reverse transcriptase domain-containing protein n=1 Tax=Araneus ventricosus TaxID=182803 RepID=A0A4Y2NA75_ARAVE|nr:hypothetical protein AVEN_8069-1 [Araneus ventricosus]